MAIARTSRSAWIQAGLRALATGGPSAVRVEALARVLGVSKGGFYWHFDNRLALLDGLLDAWELMSVDEVIERIEAEDGEQPIDARIKLARLGAIGLSGEDLWGIDPLEVDLAIRDWARRDEQVAHRLRRVDNRRMEYMRSLFGGFCADAADIEDRCLLGFSLWIGSHFIAADHSGRSRSEVMEGAFRRLLGA
jgi:AcrR family transcriptional regulator